jgi:hypothetical protein
MSNLPDADRPAAERIFGLFESATSSLSSSRRARHVERGQRTVTGNDRSPRTTKPGL